MLPRARGQACRAGFKLNFSQRGRPPCPAAADVNRHPSQVVAMMRPLLPLLHPGAAVILTLKVTPGRAAAAGRPGPLF